MKLHEMKPTAGSRKARKRVGRGDSSGLGKTAGRGDKGQHSRTGSKSRPYFEGGQIPLFRRLPKRGFNQPNHVEFNLVNVSVLEKNFAADEVVDLDVLKSKGIIGKSDLPLKVLANGELTRALTVKAAKFSEAAKAKIEAAGGKCELV
ncbi:MAG: 50S ribosomal protein L15 [Victivallales bacterium]|nr:50S ribosomal protein L15 [Victivallales bacterium]